MASSSVPSALGLAGLVEAHHGCPLICRKVRAPAALPHAPRRPGRASRGTPAPATVHRDAGTGPGHAFQHLCAGSNPRPSRLMDVSFLDVIAALRLDLVAPTTRSDEAAVYSRGRHDLRRPKEIRRKSDEIPRRSQDLHSLRRRRGTAAWRSRREENTSRFRGSERRRRRQGRRRGSRSRSTASITLIDYRYQQHFKAKPGRGRDGQGPPWRRPPTT